MPRRRDRIVAVQMHVILVTAVILAARVQKATPAPRDNDAVVECELTATNRRDHGCAIPSGDPGRRV